MSSERVYELLDEFAELRFFFDLLLDFPVCKEDRGVIFVAEKCADFGKRMICQFS